VRTDFPPSRIETSYAGCLRIPCGCEADFGLEISFITLDDWADDALASSPSLFFPSFVSVPFLETLLDANQKASESL
jgi:hypothetical protein